MTRVTPKLERLILKLYRTGKTYKEMATESGFSEASIGRVLSRHNCLRGGRGSNPRRRYSLNEAAFNGRSEAARYWLGLLVADGNVFETRLSLGLKEREHVVKFREFISSSAPVTEVRVGTGIYHRLDVYSKALVTSVGRYGIVPAKSVSVHVPKELARDRHFWRGVVDGDGWFSTTKIRKKRYLYLGLCGSRPLLRQFAEFASRLGVQGITVRPYGKVGILRVGAGRAIKLARELYRDATVFLERKARKVEAFLANAPPPGS